MLFEDAGKGSCVSIADGRGNLFYGHLSGT